MKNYSKTGLVTEEFPRRKIIIPNNENDLQFEIENTGDYIIEHNKLQISHGKNQLIFDPQENITDKDIKGRHPKMSVVQILPKTNELYKLYIGLDNRCCNGIFFSADLFVNPEGLKVSQVRYTPIPFNISGILGDEKQVLLYGSGCSGSGIRRVTLDDMCLHDDIYTTKEVDEAPFKYHGIAYGQLFNPPHLKNEKLYISCLDAKGNILSSESDHPKVRQLGFIAADIIKRKVNQRLVNAIELCIDDKVAKLENGKSICEDVKSAVEKSYLLYNYSLPCEINLRGLGWVIYSGSMDSILGKLGNSDPKAKA